ANVDDAVPDHADTPGSALTQINNPAFDKGAAVIDPYLNPASVFQISYTNDSPERKTGMGSGLFTGFKFLTAGCGFIFKGLTIIGSFSGLGDFWRTGAQGCQE